MNDKPLIDIRLDKNSPVGLHIRKKRLQLQMKQGDVAKVIGISEDCVTYWENGRSKPQVQHMPKVIKFLGYNPLKVDNETIGGQIKNYRIIHGLSHKKMGILMGVDATTIGAWESDKSPITEKNLKILEKVLKQ